MTMRYILFFLLALPAQWVLAQTEVRSLPDELRAERAGQGTVIIRQSEDVERVLLEGVKNRPARPDSATIESARLRREALAARQKDEVFRIRIFTGGNSRDDKTKAYQIANQARQAFPELGAYPAFESPRWVCNIGDFRTAEEANKYIPKVRAKHFSHECRIVKKSRVAPKK